MTTVKVTKKLPRKRPDLSNPEVVRRLRDEAEEAVKSERTRRTLRRMRARLTG